MQSFANHTKWDLKWHFIILPILTLNVGFRIYELLSDVDLSIAAVWDIVVAVALLLAGYGTRTYALKVQDRLIRLEERLRLASVLPPALQSRMGELTEPQLIGLRFASDAELPGLVEETLKTQMGTKQIKQAIKNWRADNFRV
jgi:hypothetical protein